MSNEVPAPVSNYFYAHHSAFTCYAGNVATGAAYTVEATNNEADACALVPLYYGYYRWMHNGSITCGTGAAAKTGFKFCELDLTTSTWVLRSTADSDEQSATDDSYRTLGRTIASQTTTTDANGVASTTTVEGVVRD
jgi:hypothetical protein